MSEETISEKQASNNPLAVAEEGIADIIRTCPEISGILGTESIYVFCVSSESSASIIERRIKGELGLCVFVCIDNTKEVLANERATSTVEIEVIVRAPDIMSEPYITSSDVAMAIIRTLHLAVLSEPFMDGSFVKFTGISSSNYQTADNQGAVVRELKFEAKINLL